MSAYWPGGVRREGGASLVCGCYRERGKAGADTAIYHRTAVVGGERERVERQKP